MQGGHPLAPANHMRPPTPANVPKPDGVLHPSQPKSNAVLEGSFLNQHENGDHQAPKTAGKKALLLSLFTYELATLLVVLRNQFLLLFAKEHCCLLNAVTALTKNQLSPSLNELNQI